jgi:hypothetical protein
MSGFLDTTLSACLLAGQLPVLREKALLLAARTSRRAVKSMEENANLNGMRLQKNTRPPPWRSRTTTWNSIVTIHLFKPALSLRTQSRAASAVLRSTKQYAAQATRGSFPGGAFHSPMPPHGRPDVSAHSLYTHRLRGICHRLPRTNRNASKPVNKAAVCRERQNQRCVALFEKMIPLPGPRDFSCSSHCGFVRKSLGNLHSTASMMMS